MNDNKQQSQPGRPAAKGLFIQNNPDGIYDLVEFRKVFVECEDVTEYEAAIELVGSWEEWCRIKDGYVDFNGMITVWIQEIEVKLKSRAMKKIQAVADSNTPAAFQAAKFLATAEHKRQHGAGRTSKAQIKREAQEIARSAAETKEEEGRVLSIIQGGQLP